SFYLSRPSIWTALLAGLPCPAIAEPNRSIEDRLIFCARLVGAKIPETLELHSLTGTERCCAPMNQRLTLHTQGIWVQELKKILFLVAARVFIKKKPIVKSHHSRHGVAVAQEMDCPLHLSAVCSRSSFRLRIPCHNEFL